MLVKEFLKSFRFLKFNNIDIHYLINEKTSTLYEIKNNYSEETILKVDVSIFVNDLHSYDISLTLNEEDNLIEEPNITVPDNAYYIGLRLNFNLM